jgi:hypothetical protein
MIFTLLKQIPGALARRIGYEFQRFFHAQRTGASMEPKAATPSEPSVSNDEKLQRLYETLVINYVSTAVRAMRIQLHHGSGSYYDHPNPLCERGAKVFSQNEEDGITFEIVRRLGLSNGTFAEFGVETGLENNTLALAAAGWNGFWIGAEDLSFNFNPNGSAKLNFNFDKQWVTRATIVEIYKKNLSLISRSSCNLISMDLDGNDYYFIEQLLASGASPDIFIVEYNSKFIPPIEFVIAYNDLHTWRGGDYYGASLTSLWKLFERHGYFLVCCNLTGSNAFFVRKEHQPAFPEVPAEILELYESPKHFFTGLFDSGPPVAAETLNQIFSRLNP